MHHNRPITAAPCSESICPIIALSDSIEIGSGTWIKTPGNEPSGDEKSRSASRGRQPNLSSTSETRNPTRRSPCPPTWRAPARSTASSTKGARLRGVRDGREHHQGLQGGLEALRELVPAQGGRFAGPLPCCCGVLYHRSRQTGRWAPCPLGLDDRATTGGSLGQLPGAGPLPRYQGSAHHRGLGRYQGNACEAARTEGSRVDRGRDCYARCALLHSAGYARSGDPARRIRWRPPPHGDRRPRSRTRVNGPHLTRPCTGATAALREDRLRAGVPTDHAGQACRAADQAARPRNGNWAS